MTVLINDKIQSIKPYDPAEGDYKIRLDANESYIVPDDEILKKISDSVSAVPINRYPDPNAVKLCKAFAEYYQINPEFVTAGNGSDELLFVIFTAFAEKGDTVVTLYPDFSMYKFYAHIAECRNIEIEKNQDLQIDVDKLIDRSNTSNAKLLVFSNPCNPTSLALDREQVIKIINNVSALVVLDEAYMDFYDQSLITTAHEYENLILLRTCSKMMGLAALRAGFAVANKQLTEALRKCKSPYNVNSYTQSAAAAVLKMMDYLDNCRRQIIDSKNYLYSKLVEISAKTGWTVFNSKTNFIFLKPDNAAELHDFLCSRSILVRKIDKYLRITAGSKQENLAVIDAIKQYIGE